MIEKMTQRLTVQEKSTTVDNGGGLITSWVNVTPHPTIYAHVTPIQNGKVVTGAEKLPVTQYKIIIRTRSDLTHEMRLIDGADVYTITSVLPHTEDNTFLMITADKQTA